MGSTWREAALELSSPQEVVEKLKEVNESQQAVRFFYQGRRYVVTKPGPNTLLRLFDVDRVRRPPLSTFYQEMKDTPGVLLMRVERYLAQ